jgi:hypothetical protein
MSGTCDWSTAWCVAARIRLARTEFTLCFWIKPTATRFHNSGGELPALPSAASAAPSVLKRKHQHATFLPVTV